MQHSQVPAKTEKVHKCDPDNGHECDPDKGWCEHCSGDTSDEEPKIEKIEKKKEERPIVSAHDINRYIRKIFPKLIIEEEELCTDKVIHDTFEKIKKLNIRNFYSDINSFLTPLVRPVHVIHLDEDGTILFCHFPSRITKVDLLILMAYNSDELYGLCTTILTNMATKYSVTVENMNKRGPSAAVCVDTEASPIQIFMQDYR